MDYYIASFFLIPLPIISSNPFVPDLIHEASHGFGNMLRTNMINSGTLLAYGLLTLNATSLPIFSSNMIYFSMTVFLVFTMFVVQSGMKDVIKEGNRMSES